MELDNYSTYLFRVKKIFINFSRVMNNSQIILRKTSWFPSAHRDSEAFTHSGASSSPTPPADRETNARAASTLSDQSRARYRSPEIRSPNQVQVIAGRWKIPGGLKWFEFWNLIKTERFFWTFEIWKTLFLKSELWTEVVGLFCKNKKCCVWFGICVALCRIQFVLVSFVYFSWVPFKINS